MTILNNLDFNCKLAPSIDSNVPKKAPQNYNPARIAQAILPLLTSVPVLSFGLQIYAGSCNSIAAMKVLEKRNGNTIENQAYLGMQVASLALLFFNPLAVSIIEQTKGIYHNTMNCKHNIVDGEYKKALLDTFSLAGKVVYIASIVTGGTNLILISMVSQGVFELYKSKQFYNKGMYLEALVQSVMAVSRGSTILKTHQTEIKESYESFKAQFSKTGTVTNSSCRTKIYHAYYVAINWSDGFKFHVADYYDGTRVVTCLNGPFEGDQAVGLYGNVIDASNDVEIHSNYVVHYYVGGEIVSTSNSQYILIY